MDPDEVTAQLGAREPIFHRREFCSGPDDFDRMVATDFWEVGASGTVYDRAHTREVVLVRISATAPDPWEITEFRVRELAPSTFLATYRLTQGSRVTRRSTIWRRVGDDWVIAYHQGTMIGAR